MANTWSWTRGTDDGDEGVNVGNEDVEADVLWEDQRLMYKKDGDGCPKLMRA